MNSESQIGPAPAERFLSQALGDNSGDPRIPAGLMTLALVLAVAAVSWKKLRARRAASEESETVDEI